MPQQLKEKILATWTKNCQGKGEMVEQRSDHEPDCIHLVLIHLVTVHLIPIQLETVHLVPVLLGVVTLVTVSLSTTVTAI